MLVVAACAGTPAPAPQPQPQPTRVPPVDLSLPEIGPAPPMAIPQLPASPPEPPPLAVAPMAPPPTDAVSLRARYGAPDFIRREMDSELWRYDAQNCAIFFFLYRDGNALKLRYSETMPRGMTMAADPACLQSLNARAGMS